MTIKELISNLRQILAEEGDIEVIVGDDAEIFGVISDDDGNGDTVAKILIEF